MASKTGKSPKPGATLLQMLEFDLDATMRDLDVDGMSDFDAGFVEGYAGGLINSIATIRDPYRRDFDATCKQIVADSRARLTEHDLGE